MGKSSKTKVTGVNSLSKAVCENIQGVKKVNTRAEEKTCVRDAPSFVRIEEEPRCLDE